ncbi:hypothetical protein CAPTEDRAFT_214659 [Capitella teleta]|uniref:Peptidase aspartic putative domain-containing protein n=1 Tax=Capitella teleta TaxID=283909 RepID=R7UG32_CAPTE|nr:hypothetical protein CAPTEDRAFT_214659 [Capitella teleta]|eukprot:ELU05155.1 hypothetical protein CAPTEDRAFT_214659 [Capitella teleta]
MSASTGGPRVLLGIVPIEVCSSNGSTIIVNALLDNGSSHTFCSEDLLRRLDVKGRKVQYCVSTLTASDAEAAAVEVDLDVRGLDVNPSVAPLKGVCREPETYCMKDGLLLLGGQTPPNEPTQWTPVILHWKGHVSSLIVLHCHYEQGHVDVEQTLAATDVNTESFEDTPQ